MDDSTYGKDKPRCRKRKAWYQVIAHGYVLGKEPTIVMIPFLGPAQSAEEAFDGFAHTLLHVHNYRPEQMDPNGPDDDRVVIYDLTLALCAPVPGPLSDELDKLHGIPYDDERVAVVRSATILTLVPRKSSDKDPDDPTDGGAKT